MVPEEYDEQHRKHRILDGLIGNFLFRASKVDLEFN